MPLAYPYLEITGKVRGGLLNIVSDRVTLNRFLTMVGRNERKDSLTLSLSTSMTPCTYHQRKPGSFSHSQTS